MVNSYLVSKLGTGSLSFTRCQKIIFFVHEDLQGITLEFVFGEEWSRLLTFSNDNITYTTRNRKTGTDSTIFTGDSVYKDILFAYYPSTAPEAYLNSLKKISSLPVKKVFPAHHSLDIQPEILFRMRKAFEQLEADGKLHHGSGTFNYGDWGVWL